MTNGAADGRLWQEEGQQMLGGSKPVVCCLMMLTYEGFEQGQEQQR